MNHYEILDDQGKLLFDIYAENCDQAIAEAKKSDRKAYRAKIVYVDYRDQERGRKK